MTDTDRAREIARDIMDNACLPEPCISNGIDRAMRKTIAEALQSYGAEREREGIRKAAKAARNSERCHIAVYDAILALLDAPEQEM